MNDDSLRFLILGVYSSNRDSFRLAFGATVSTATALFFNYPIVLSPVNVNPYAVLDTVQLHR